jgi:hypothetical protein
MREWGSVHSRRFVLPVETGYDAVAELTDSVAARKVRDVSPDVIVGLAREVTWQLTPSDFLHYGLDATTRRSYVQVTGVEDEPVAHFSGIVSEYFDAVDDETLLGAVDAASTADERRGALIVLGMGAPAAVDRRFLDRIEEGLHAQSEGVREGALYGAAYTLWPSLVESVRRMAAEDPSEAIRRQAQALVDWIRETGQLGSES